MRPRVRFAIVLALLVGVVPPVLLKQQQSPVSSPNSQTSTLFVTVEDSQGRPVSDLRKEEFRIWVGGAAVEITDFQPDGNWPLLLGLLFDVSGSRRGQWPGEEGEPAVEFAQRVLRQGDAAFVTSLRGDSSPEQDVTVDFPRVAKAIRGVTRSMPKGGLALFDTIVLYTDFVQRDPRDRKAFVIVTDGQDNESNLSSARAVEAALRSDTALYFICLPAPSWWNRKDAHKNRRIVEHLANETGGAVAFISRPEELTGAFQEIESQIRGQYRLRFKPNPSRKDGKLQSLRIKTTRSGLKVLARKGYYAPRN